MEQLEEIDWEDLQEMLALTESLEEQGDIVYVLWLKKGPDWIMNMDTNASTATGSKTTIRTLVEELYVRACQEHVWWLVRLTAGLLGKRVEDLAKAVTDLLVRQKQITVGMPAISEEAITAPLTPEQLETVIGRTFGNDLNSAVLTQEILVYLGMFVRTEPQLFQEMLRLRVGLIIQVMAGELARALHITAEEATQHLLSISPYEMKTLLHNILSGKEIEEVAKNLQLEGMNKKLKEVHRFVNPANRQKSFAGGRMLGSTEESVEDEDERSEGDGFWLRRRRIDGALNRVPPDFYSKIWYVLTKCEGLVVGGAENTCLHQNLTKEMTREEVKFALRVETMLNRIPEPEYRQLVVEAMMVLTLVSENHTNVKLGPGPIPVEEIVRRANSIFIEDQITHNGDATVCCAKRPPEHCDGVHGVCVHFYDSPPSGRYGTITYLCRAIAHTVPLGEDGEIECAVQ